MKYRTKNEATGVLGFTIFATKKAANESARFHAKLHGVKITVVDEQGRVLPKQTRAEKNAGLDNLQWAVNTWNFASAGALVAARMAEEGKRKAR